MKIHNLGSDYSFQDKQTCSSTIKDETISELLPITEENANHRIETEGETVVDQARIPSENTEIENKAKNKTKKKREEARSKGVQPDENGSI